MSAKLNVRRGLSGFSGIILSTDSDGGVYKVHIKDKHCKVDLRNNVDETVEIGFAEYGNSSEDLGMFILSLRELLKDYNVEWVDDAELLYEAINLGRLSLDKKNMTTEVYFETYEKIMHIDKF